MRNQEHLKPEWQENEFYKAYMEAKNKFEEASKENSPLATQLETLEEDLRQKHLAWVYDRLNNASKVQFTHRVGGKGFFIS